MASKDREAFFMGINGYVPGMAYDSKMAHGQPTAFSLGTPIAADNDIIDTDIDAAATAGTETTQNYTCDAEYGRTLTMNANADPGAGGIVDVHGFDYLYQPMVERFTFVSGSTAVLYGKKAFKYVSKTEIIGAAANATTYDLGVGFALGLPYKGDVAWAKENGVLVPLFKRDFQLTGQLSGAEVTSGRSLLFRAPCPGFVKTLYAIPSGAGSTTNAATTVEIATVAVTGLTVTADQDTQTIVSDVPTTEGYNANNRFRPGDLLELVHAATTGGGTTAFALELTPTQFVLPVITDPQTVTLGDPRGTYESLTTMDGVKEIIVGLVGDNYVNSSGNGGLHGIRHVVA